MKKLFTLLILLLLWAGSSWAQSTYSFVGSSGTYIEITGGTVLGGIANDDERFVDPALPAGGTTVTGVGFPIGFNFTYGGVVFDRLAINTNGWISLGQSALTPSVNNASSSAYVPLSSTTAITPADLVCRIAAVGKDQQGQTGSEIRIETIGVAPNRVCVVQWKGYRTYNAVGDNYNYQIRLIETSNEVKIVYGIMTKNTTSTTVQVGLRGAPATTASNFNTRSTTTNWAATTAGTASSTCTFSSTVYPANGYTYTYTPPTPCANPLNQATSLVLTPLSTSISGSFTVAAGSDSYLVVRTPDATLTATPVNGTTYALAATLGNGTIVSNTGATFSATGLTAGTLYYFHIFSMNSLCSGGPLYLTLSPLTGSATTAPNPPVSITATSFSSSQINLSAVANAAANDIMVAWSTNNVWGTPSGTYNPGDPISGGGTALYTGAAASLPNHTGLASGILYYYRVWSKAGTIYSSTYASSSATTQCLSVSTFPFDEGFETGFIDQAIVGGCWSQEVTGAYSWTANSTLSSYNRAPHAGTWDTYLHYSGNSWLFRKFTLTGGVSYDASCWARQDGATLTDATVEIKYGTTATGAGMTTTIVAATGLNATYVKLIGSFTPAVTGEYYIGFHGVINGTPWYITLDDIQVLLTPSCTAPTAINVTSITNNSAFVGWTGGGVNAQIDYGSVGHVAGTGTIVNSAVNPKQITGLTPNTAYHVFVRQDCGAGGYSTWTGPQLLNTACDPSTAITENFDAVTIPSLPNCWGKFSSYASGSVTTILSTSNSTPNCAQIYNSGATSTDNILLISPFLSNLGAGTHELRFYAKSSSTLATTVVVGTMSDPANGATFSPFQTITINSSTFTQGVVSFASYSGSNKYIAFRHPCQTTYSNIYIDDVLWQLLPPCPPPTLLTTTGITGVSAILNWANGQSETMWNVKYGAPGFNPLTEGTLISGITAHPYTLSPPLSASTTYDWYVNADCGGAKVLSAWGGPATFTTPCVAAVVPFIEGFESATFPPSACWANTAVSGIYTWVRSTAASGNGSGTGSAYANFYDQSSGSKYDLKTMPFDITGIAAPLLKFNYAYATYSGEADQMDVYSSTDNGSTWNLFLSMPGGTSGILNTGGTTTASFIPTAAQWGTKTLAIPAGTNMIKFTATSAYGNNLYLDNIQVYQLLAHDVAATGINLNQVVPSGLQSPIATVMNEGTNAETFNVTLTIGAYTSTQVVTTLGAGLSQVVTFAPWTAVDGNYTATLTTLLAGDLYAANNTLSKSFKVMALNKEVYGYTTFSTSNNGPIKFNLSNPGTITEIVNEYPTITYPASGTWANGLWYATIYASASPYNLVTFNTTTGARTVIGDMGVNINAMSYNTANNTMYGAGYNGATSLLYTINLTTGNATLVGTIGTYLIINMAINNAGVCYATDLAGDILGTINLTTGAFSPIGSIGFDAQYAQDMEFDRETGELFMAAYGATGELRWVDKTNGSTLVIGQFQGGAEVTGFAIPYSSNKTLNLSSVMLEGLYNGAGTMRQAADGTGNPHFTAPTADQVTVELHDAANYASILHTAAAVNLSTSGTATVSVPATFGGSYFITIKHRNSVETTTAAAVSFAGSTISQSFGAPASVFGANLGLTTDSYYVIYAGDVNQDGAVDSGDFTPVDNDAFNYVTGYLATDINGDGAIDSGDFTSIDNNGFNYVGTAHP